MTISSDRLAALIQGWQHEAAAARGSLRSDDYAATCQDTAQALREVEALRRVRDAAKVLMSSDVIFDFAGLEKAEQSLRGSLLDYEREFRGSDKA